MSIKLSLVELGAVGYGQTRSDAIKDVIETAQKIETWGYNRIWLAEHHNTANMISRAPEVIIPLVASNTTRIRVGSGSVLLNHYSPFKVAEVFTLLGDMFPGRIDMGIDAVEWAKKVEELGAGEILLTSMDCDGTRQGDHRSGFGFCITTQSQYAAK